MKIKFKKGDYVTFVKISDDRFNGNHPNDINEGYTHSGIMFHDIIIGHRADISGLSTSDVKEILSEDTFKTRNSTYKILLAEELNKN